MCARETFVAVTYYNVSYLYGSELWALVGS